MTENASSSPLRQSVIAGLGWAAVLNVPLVVCHPGPLIVDEPWVRSLVVGLVLFLIPGVPWVGVMIGRGWLQRFEWVWAVSASLVVMLVAVAAIRLSGRSLDAGRVWNAVWVLTNGAIVLNTVVRGPPACGIDLSNRFTRLGILLFLAAHLLFFYSATRVVPPMEDQDFDVVTCGYGLITRFEPLQATDRAIYHQFAHPPLALWCTAASFLYFDRLDYLEPYDAAARRAQAAHEGIDFDCFDGTVGGLSKGIVDDHRVVGREGSDYIVAPALSDGSRRIPVWLLENAVILQYYERDPQKVVARTANVFLAALTVALLGCFVGRMTATWRLAVLIPLAYATSPEIFVRSGYGGHFASSNLAALLLLMALEQRSRGGGKNVFLAGMLLALVNQKLILLPVAVVVWKLFFGRESKISRRVARALLHPAVVGFAAGVALFWSWGLAIDAADFWQDQVRIHFVDRLLHHNPFGHGGYPSVARLWIEFWQHTGYVLLPLGVATLVALALRRGDSNSSFSPRLWLVWTLLTAIVFSLVDWRQTKHLMPLMLSLHVAPACWAASRGSRSILLAVVLVALTAWNLYTMCQLAEDFAGFSITPAW